MKVGILTSIISFLALLIALMIGWFASHEQGLGVFIATIVPLSQGVLPATIFGHGRMKGTPPVPDDLQPQPRPVKEMFLELPGGYKMPQNGIGMCCRYSAYDDVLVRRTVLWYLLKGGRLIDTAHLYLNHRAVGLGIRDAMERGIPREEIFVTTKIWPSDYGYNRTQTMVPIFLEELGLEYIDLILMHWPGHPISYKWINHCRTLSSLQECRADTYRALSLMRSQGLTRNVGVSNFAVHHLQQIQSLQGDIAPIAANQIKYNPWAPEFVAETFAYCQEHGIAVTAYASLGGYMQHAEATTVETLTKLGAKYDVSVAQIMLRWALQINAAIIPGTGNPKHMDENLNVYNFMLTQEEMDEIEKLRTDESAKKFLYADVEMKFE